MSVTLKAGVQLRGMTPQILLVIMVAEGVYGEHDYPLVVTSVCDGKHSWNSLHYVGMAIDFRTRHLAAGDNLKITGELKACLGLEFDVVLETDHIHVEWQPERS